MAEWAGQWFDRLLFVHIDRAAAAREQRRPAIEHSIIAFQTWAYFVVLRLIGREQRAADCVCG